MSLADEVKKWMQTKGFGDDVNKLSFASEVNASTILKMLDNDTDMYLNNAMKIADALGVPLDTLVHPERDCADYQDFYDSIQQGFTTSEYNDNKKRPKKG